MMVPSDFDWHDDSEVVLRGPVEILDMQEAA